MDWRGEWRGGIARSAIVLACAVGLVGCGGSDDGARAPDAATVGPAGGAVSHPDGAQVIFPARALNTAVTVRIARDGAGAPPLPDIAMPAGAVYVFTPHGGAFAAPAQVSIPVERSTIAANEQLVLLSAEPGDSQWRVLSAARYDGGKLHAPVAHFSYFQAAVIVDRWVPTLVSSVDNRNNLGGGGIERISPFEDITTATSLPMAQLTWPDPRMLNGLTGPTQPPAACLPTRWGHDASEWRWVRNGTETIAPDVWHRRAKRADPWPRFPSDWGVDSPYFGEANRAENWVAGYGALHYYGEETPRIYGYADAGPYYEYKVVGYQLPDGTYPKIGDPYTLPPVNDRVGDNLLTWSGRITWTVFRSVDPLTMTEGRNPPNGPMRVDVSVMTNCGVLVEAAPLLFQLNAPLAWQPSAGYATDAGSIGTVLASDRDMLLGTSDRLVFEGSRYTDWNRTSIKYSPDPTRVAWTPVAPSRLTYYGSTIELRMEPVAHVDAGYYRADYCNVGIEGSTPPGCGSGPAARVRVIELPPLITAQPTSMTIAKGETASFTVAARGGPPPAVQWERRESPGAGWIKIPGANAMTYTTPAVSLADAGSEFRAVLTNVAGRTDSGVAVLTVVERYMPPRITAQPGDLEVPVGGTAVFAATVDGTAPLSYQWRHKAHPIAGANSPILTLYNVTGATEGAFDLVVSNREGSVTSRAATLKVVVGTPQTQPVTIVDMPVQLWIPQDYLGTLTVSASGTGPFTYQWMKGDEAIPGATGAAHSIYPAKPSDSGFYWVRVANALGTVSSPKTEVFVVPNDQGAPRIQAGPTTLAVLAGLGATFGVSVTGAAPMSYQWRHNGIDIPGATQSVLHLPSASALDAGKYSVVVANPLGKQASGEAQLVVIGPPVINSHPAAATAPEGGRATFSVAAAGDGLRYQWLRDRVAIRDATAATYTTPGLTSADNGVHYSVLVYNGSGAVFSQEALLTVSSAPPATWTPALQIAGGGDMVDPAVGLDGNGRALAVWANYPTSGAAGRVQFSVGNAGGWSAAAIIDGGFVNGYETRVATTANGKAIAAWGYAIGGAYHLAAAHFDGTTWAAPVRVDTSQAGNSTNHALAMDEQGRGVLAWSQPIAGSYRVHASIGSGGTWSAPIVFDRGATAGLPAVAVNSQGKGFVVFNESSDTVVAVPVDTAVGFGTPEVIRAKGRPVGWTRVTVDALGNALALWIDGTLDGDRLRYARHVAGAGWSAPADVDAIGWPRDSNWALAGSSSGDAAVAWAMRGIDGREAVHVRRFSPGGGWGPAERISSDGRYAETPLVVMNGGGRLVVTWIETDPTDALYQVWGRVHDGSWRSAQLLQSPGLDGRVDWQRGLAIASSGTAVSLWREWAVDGTQPLMSSFWP